MIEEKKENTNKFDKRIISSAHINFLFGAGVNGNAFPQLDGFGRTCRKIKELGGNVDNGFENGVDTLENEEDRQSIKRVFMDEFAEKVSQIDFKKESVKNIENLLRKTYQIVKESQNRNPDMKQINIYSLNYDNIIERCLMKLGYFSNSIAASNVSEVSQLIDVIGYNYNSKKYIPSFMISKLHGDMSNPILPGKEKYNKIIDENYFEIVFNMKAQLSRQNSILIVLGYSGNDKHINKIIHDCIDTGLIVYWFKYDNKEKIPYESFDNSTILIREQNDNDEKVDTTKVCFEDLEETWTEKSEE